MAISIQGLRYREQCSISFTNFFYPANQVFKTVLSKIVFQVPRILCKIPGLKDDFKEDNRPPVLLILQFKYFDLAGWT